MQQSWPCPSRNSSSLLLLLPAEQQEMAGRHGHHCGRHKAGNYCILDLCLPPLTSQLSLLYGPSLYRGRILTVPRRSVLFTPTQSNLGQSAASPGEGACAPFPAPNGLVYPGRQLLVHIAPVVSGCANTYLCLVSLGILSPPHSPSPGPRGLQDKALLPSLSG